MDGKYTYIDLNVDKLVLDFSKELGEKLQDIAGKMNEEMYTSTKIKFKGAEPNEKFMKEGTLRTKASYITENFEQNANLVYIELVQNAYAILSSYGTGKSRDKNNPFWEEYTQSEYFNSPLRKGDAIVGRPSGEYTNIFGQKVESSGALEGQEINSFEYYPSYAIQKTESRWFGDSDGEVLNSDCLFVKTLVEFSEDWLNANMGNNKYMNDEAIGGV